MGGEGLAGERNTLKIYVIISNISGKGINKEKILRGNFFLSSRVTYHQQVGYRESCVYYTKKVNVVRSFQ